MQYTRTDGIVIKQVDIEEADRIITIFTRKLGKIQVRAKGARRPRSKFLACSQIFSYGDFLIYKSGEMYVLVNCELKNSFTELGSNLAKLGAATFILELVLKTMEDEMPNIALLRLMLNVIYKISTEETEVKYLLVFMIRFLNLSGFMPVLDKCVSCSNGEIGKDYINFSIENGGIVCEKCSKNNIMQITFSEYKALVFMTYTIDKNMFSFKLSEKSLNNLYNIMKLYYEKHFEIKSDSLNYIDVQKE